MLSIIWLGSWAMIGQFPVHNLRYGPLALLTFFVVVANVKLQQKLWRILRNFNRIGTRQQWCHAEFWSWYFWQNGRKTLGRWWQGSKKSDNFINLRSKKLKKERNIVHKTRLDWQKLKYFFQRKGKRWTQHSQTACPRAGQAFEGFERCKDARKFSTHIQ